MRQYQCTKRVISRVPAYHVYRGIWHDQARGVQCVGTRFRLGTDFGRFCQYSRLRMIMIYATTYLKRSVDSKISSFLTLRPC